MGDVLRSGQRVFALRQFRCVDAEHDRLPERLSFDKAYFGLMPHQFDYRPPFEYGLLCFHKPSLSNAQKPGNDLKPDEAKPSNHFLSPPSSPTRNYLTFDILTERNPVMQPHPIPRLKRPQSLLTMRTRAGR